MLSLWICLDIGVVRASDVWSATPSSPSHTVTFLLDGPLVTKAPLVDVDSPPVGRGYFFPQSLQFDSTRATPQSVLPLPSPPDASLGSLVAHAQ